MQATAYDFLVAADGIERLAGAQIGHGGQLAEGADQAGDALLVGIGQGAAHLREASGRQHAVSDGLAVTKPAIARQCLEGVSDRVAEVQGAPGAGLSLVLHDHIGLDPAAGGNHFREHGGVVVEDGRQVAADLIVVDLDEPWIVREADSGRLRRVRSARRLRPRAGYPCPRRCGAYVSAAVVRGRLPCPACGWRHAKGDEHQ